MGRNEGRNRRAKLTAAFVRTIDRAGKYGDEHGLILRVLPTGSKQWIWRGTVRGRRVDLGLGGYPYTSLAEARQTAFEHRKLARAGGDPRALTRSVPTFAEAAEKVISIHRASWRPGSKSEAQWRASLRDYAMPRLGSKRVGPDLNGRCDGRPLADLDHEGRDCTKGTAARSRR